jgi:hypothetical protein
LSVVVATEHIRLQEERVPRLRRFSDYGCVNAISADLLKRVVRLDQVEESGSDTYGQIAAIAWREKFVAGAGDGEQLGGCGDELKGCFHFGCGGKAIVYAVDKQDRSFEIGKMAGAQLCRALGRVERVGEQKEGRDETGIGSSQHGSLPASVRMAT